MGHDLRSARGIGEKAIEAFGAGRWAKMRHADRSPPVFFVNSMDPSKILLAVRRSRPNNIVHR